MVREPDATMQPTPQDNQLMSKHRVLSLKPQLRLEWRGQDGQKETDQNNHSASLSDSITASTRIRFSVHTAICTHSSGASESSVRINVQYKIAVGGNRIDLTDILTVGSSDRRRAVPVLRLFAAQPARRCF